MGTFTVEVEVGDLNFTRPQVVEVLVDTGATYTMLPASLLRSLGVSPTRVRYFVIANGQRIRREVGQAAIRIGDEVIFNIVVFAEEDSQPLLGAFTLEAFSLAADPVNQKLVHVDALAMGYR